MATEKWSYKDLAPKSSSNSSSTKSSSNSTKNPTSTTPSTKIITTYTDVSNFGTTKGTVLVEKSNGQVDYYQGGKLIGSSQGKVDKIPTSTLYDTSGGQVKKVGSFQGSSPSNPVVDITYTPEGNVVGATVTGTKNVSTDTNKNVPVENPSIKADSSSNKTGFSGYSNLPTTPYLLTSTAPKYDASIMNGPNLIPSRTPNSSETMIISPTINNNLFTPSKVTNSEIHASKPDDFTSSWKTSGLTKTETFEVKANTWIDKNLAHGDQLSMTGAGVASVGLGVYKFAKDIVFDISPLGPDMKARVPLTNTAMGISSALSDPVGAVKGLKSQFAEKPYETIGYVGAPLIIGLGVGKASTSVKNQYVKFGATKVAPEEVYSSQVLTGKRTLPVASSTEQSLALFREGVKGKSYEVGDYTKLKVVEYKGEPPINTIIRTDTLSVIPENVKGYSVRPSIRVSTASESALKNTDVGMGAKASAGLEDPGIYVTASGEGSPYFHGIDGNKYTLSLNPKNMFNTNLLKQPTVTEFRVKGVDLQPRKVVNIPGFEGVKTFFEETGSKTGKAYITKRSEIGQGSVPRREFTITKEVVDPWTGKTLKPGQRVWEKGTSEQEGIIPFQGKFKYVSMNDKVSKFKGYNKYTTYKGVNIPIREAKLLSFDSKGRLVKTSGVQGKALDVSVVGEEQSYLMSSVSRGKVVTPYPSIIASSSMVKPSYKSSIMSSSISPTSSGLSSVSSYKVPSYSVTGGSSYGGGSSKSIGGYSVTGGSSYGGGSSKSIGGYSVTGGSSYGGGSSKRGGGSYTSGGYRSPPPSTYLSDFPLAKKEKKMYYGKKSKGSKKSKLIKPSVYILPDLKSVSKTEAYNYAKFGGGESIAPRATKNIVSLAKSAMSGTSAGFIPTEQMRLGKVKI